MSSSEYQRALEYLFARTTGGVRFGLDRTFAILEALGNPHAKVPCFHVAGTNGKGSTVASMAAMLEYKGMRVATYTSPHLIDFRERIVVDGVAIGEDDVVRFVRDHVDLIERLGATFFEATTALAFDYIARSGADVAVIETGLGGRLDSTNVVDPLAAVVTSISLDHTELLGDSVEKIAREKAGIYKRGRPAVVGMMRQSDPVVPATLETSAALAGASVVRSVDREVEMHWIETSRVWSAPNFTAFSATINGRAVNAKTGLIGRHQAWNAVTAWLTLDAAGPPWAARIEDLEPALADLSVPGRFQRIGDLLFDVAHNPQGLSGVLTELRGLNPPRPIRALIGILSDKDWKSMLTLLAGSVDEIIATIAPTAPSDRRWNLAEVAKFAADFAGDAHDMDATAGGPRTRRIDLRPIADFDEALRAATAGPGATLITGSFHTVGDAMARLQVNPLAG